MAIYFYYGDERYGLIISSEEFYDRILNHSDNYHHKYMRIGVFNVLPISRLNHSNDYLKNVLMFKLSISTIIKK